MFRLFNYLYGQTNFSEYLILEGEALSRAEINEFFKNVFGCQIFMKWTIQVKYS